MLKIQSATMSNLECSDAHKFIKDSCGKLSTNFHKDASSFSSSFRSPQIQ
eukprot:UN04673